MGGVGVLSIWSRMESVRGAGEGTMFQVIRSINDSMIVLTPTEEKKLWDRIGNVLTYYDRKDIDRKQFINKVIDILTDVR